jgi:hypothetical protein
MAINPSNMFFNHDSLHKSECLAEGVYAQRVSCWYETGFSGVVLNKESPLFFGIAQTMQSHATKHVGVPLGVVWCVLCRPHMHQKPAFCVSAFFSFLGFERPQGGFPPVSVLQMHL